MFAIRIDETVNIFTRQKKNDHSYEEMSLWDLPNFMDRRVHNEILQSLDSVSLRRSCQISRNLVHDH